MSELLGGDEPFVYVGRGVQMGLSGWEEGRAVVRGGLIRVSRIGVTGWDCLGFAHSLVPLPWTFQLPLHVVAFREEIVVFGQDDAAWKNRRRLFRVALRQVDIHVHVWRTLGAVHCGVLAVWLALVLGQFFLAVLLDWHGNRDAWQQWGCPCIRHVSVHRVAWGRIVWDIA